MLAAAAVLLVTNLAFVGLVEVTGAELRTRDVGDVFEKAGEIAVYLDERLAAAATGEELPEPPTIRADQKAITFGLATTLAFNVLVIGVVALVARHGVGELFRRLGLTDFRARELWRPALAVLGCYVMVAAYASIVNALDIEVLQPERHVAVRSRARPADDRAGGRGRDRGGSAGGGGVLPRTDLRGAAAVGLLAGGCHLGSGLQRGAPGPRGA